MTTTPALRFLRPRDVPIALAALDALVAHEDGGLPDPRGAGALEEVDLLLSRLPPADAGRCRAILTLVGGRPPHGGGLHAAGRRDAAPALRRGGSPRHVGRRDPDPPGARGRRLDDAQHGLLLPRALRDRRALAARGRLRRPGRRPRAALR